MRAGRIPDRAGHAFRTRDSAPHAGYISSALRASYLHLRAPAPAQIDIAGLPAGQLNRGVQRNRSPGEHIGVGAGAHNSAAHRHPVRATFELDVARQFPLGGLGWRCHAHRRADHRCNRNYSSDCHVAPVVGPASGGLTNKSGRIDVAQPKISPDPKGPTSCPFRYRWILCTHACPLSANSGRMHCSKRSSYSITSSAHLDAIYFGSDFTSFAICRQVSSST